MKKMICKSCNYILEPAMFDVDGAEQFFEDLPEDWVCPGCGGGKEEFVEKIDK